MVKTTDQEKNIVNQSQSQFTHRFIIVVFQKFTNYLKGLGDQVDENNYCIIYIKVFEKIKVDRIYWFKIRHL